MNKRSAFHLLTSPSLYNSKLWQKDKKNIHHAPSIKKAVLPFLIHLKCDSSCTFQILMQIGKWTIVDLDSGPYISQRPIHRLLMAL